MKKLALVRKSIRDARLLLVSTAGVLCAFCWLRVWIVSLLPTDRFKTIVEQFQEFERFLPVPFEQLFTYPGRIAMAYDEFIVVMCMAIWAIARGSDSVAGELGRGTMEMVAAQPVSRKHILLTQGMITVLGAALLALASWIGLYAGIQTMSVKEPAATPELGLPVLGFAPVTGLLQHQLEQETRVVPMSEKVNPHDLWPATVNYFAFGFFLAGLSTLFSALNRYRWRTIGIVAGIYSVQLVTKVIGLASDRYSWLLKFTFFTAYEPERWVSLAVNQPAEAWRFMLVDKQGQWAELGPLGFDVLLIGMGIVAYVGATVVFSRRDLPAPV